MEYAGVQVCQDKARELGTISSACMLVLIKDEEREEMEKIRLGDYIAFLFQVRSFLPY